MLQIREFLKEHLAKTKNETANSFDGTNYNDGDEGEGLTGRIFKRMQTQIGTPLSPVAENLDKDPGEYSFDEETDPGMYSFFGLTPETSKKLYLWAKAHCVPNLLTQDQMHSTIVHSTRTIGDYVPCGSSVQLDPKSFSIDLLNDALVLKYSNNVTKSQWVQAKNMGAQLSFPNFISHITLSYDPGDFEYYKIGAPDFPIVLDKEYIQTLDKNTLHKESVNIAFQSVLDKAKDVVQRWVEKGDTRKSMTHLARKAVSDPLFQKFHPGKIKVHRGENDNSVSKDDRGTSWSKEKKVAQKYASEDGEVHTKIITPKIPALDINKILGKSIKDKEVFVAKE